MKHATMALLLAAGTMMAGTLTAEAQGQNGRYCLVTRDGGQNCGFSTRSQCEKARRGLSSEPCMINPQSGRRR